jgi:hypothetical protein
MKKKILLILVVFIYSNNYGQVNFNNAKQYLKELIAIQSLLAENRLDDLKVFFAKYGYVGVPNSKNIFAKMDLNAVENDVLPAVIINSGATDIYVDNFIEIIFIKKGKDDYLYDYSYGDAVTIEKTIKNQYETGLLFTMLDALDNYKKKGSVNVEKVDRYTYKRYSDEKPDEIYYSKASNFSSIPSKDESHIAFYGPGKTMLTEIIYQPPIKGVNVEGNFSYKLTLASWKLQDPDSSEKFNVDFFMSLKNFNDRIWLDK